jgi:hypothetical protein
MVRIAFILLCHKDPDAVIRQAERLTAAGDCIAIHYDANAPRADFARIRAALDGNPNVAFPRRQVRCGWGDWSLVAATLAALRAAEAAFPRATHFYLLSGDCMAIKSHRYAHARLAERDADFIESVDFLGSDWIKTGLKEERLVYRHFFNERRHPRLFYAALALQRRLGLSRRWPDDLAIMIGSQWWCLRRSTVEAVLDFVRRRRDVVRFFRTTWIPDETFFQTLVRRIVPRQEIVPRTPTFLAFSDYGMPATFYNDHYDLLLAQDFLFARKISPHAHDLKRRLGELYASDREAFPISNEGQRLYRFLTGRGRVGRRFAARFWEREGSIGRDRVLLVLVCKKWHVAKRLGEAIEAAAGITAIGYLFSEESTPLPDLGGIGQSLGKRARHRRALLRMLFEHFGTDRMVICVDPADIELMRDFEADRCETRFLEVECVFDDAYLQGHARRVGLAGAETPEPALAGLVQAIRTDFAREADVIRDAGFAGLHRVSERFSEIENAFPLASFLRIDEERARAIARTEQLFSD